MKFAKLRNQCKGGDGRIRTKTSKFGHHHTCTGCKALQSSYLQHICTRQILCKFVFSSCVTFKVDKIFSDKSMDSNAFNGAKKSTDIAESVCEKNVRILLKISVPEFKPAHWNFRPAPSNPREKLISRTFYPHPRLLPAPRAKLSIPSKCHICTVENRLKHHEN